MAVFFGSLKAARDEFTIDLVEQCSFQKQRVMHLVMDSRLSTGSLPKTNNGSLPNLTLKPQSWTKVDIID
ncbi:hypothetical protein JHK87_010118 [Glycine soja]|nr:hypothetical protein JHK87_010118 [Glycine soja]